MNLLILGLGYTASHVLALYRNRFDAIAATCRSEAGAAAALAAGARPIRLDSDDGELAQAVAGCDVLLASAAPDAGGDPFLPRLSGLSLAGKHCLYLSTVGVYGDHGGDWVDETTAPEPVSQRSSWRLEAEQAWQSHTAATGARLDILRLSGIYGPGQNAIENLRAGSARRIIKPGQVFNRIHIADIAHAIAALIERSTGGVWNVTDDEPAPPQDVIAYAAQLIGAPVPPEILFESASLSPMGRSFFGENKRVANRKIKRDLGFVLTYPTYREGLAALVRSA